jgi:hypothetical protein
MTSIVGGAGSPDETYLAFDDPQVEPNSGIRSINSDKIGLTR